MPILSLILFVLGFVLCMLAAWRVEPTPRPHLGWLGIAACILAVILERAPLLAR